MKRIIVAAVLSLSGFIGLHGGVAHAYGYSSVHGVCSSNGIGSCSFDGGAYDPSPYDGPFQSGSISVTYSGLDQYVKYGSYPISSGTSLIFWANFYSNGSLVHTPRVQCDRNYGQPHCYQYQTT